MDSDDVLREPHKDDFDDHADVDPADHPLLRLAVEAAKATASLPATTLFSAGFETGLRMFVEHPAAADELLTVMREGRAGLGAGSDGPGHAMRHLAGLPCRE